MKHLILGAGNLGKDLLLELNKIDGACPEILSQSRGVGFSDYCALFEEIRKRKPSVLWLAVGGGSVPEAKIGTETHPRARYLNEILPSTLNIDVPPSCKVVYFSTDYVADEENPSDPTKHTSVIRSEYAKQKLAMEHWLLSQNKPNRAIVRVTSLYGIHKPEKTFPGKILKNFADKKGRLLFPQNKVTPTPTRWLASVLVNNFSKLFDEGKTSIHHCAPKGNISVKNWAKMVLEGIRETKEFVCSYDSIAHVDLERPYSSNLGCSFADVHHFLELWNVYYKKEWFQKSHIPASEVLKTIDFTVKL